MEVKLDRRYPLKASTHQAWVVLADIRATAACMPGAQITDQTDATRYKGVVKSKVGPAVMSACSCWAQGPISLVHRQR
jgi:carbon monoxide dehydrogenase subunit G